MKDHHETSAAELAPLMLQYLLAANAEARAGLLAKRQARKKSKAHRNANSNHQA
jgi:hypothetical protein